MLFKLVLVTNLVLLGLSFSWHKGCSTTIFNRLPLVSSPPLSVQREREVKATSYPLRYTHTLVSLRRDRTDTDNKPTSLRTALRFLEKNRMLVEDFLDLLAAMNPLRITNVDVFSVNFNESAFIGDETDLTEALVQQAFGKLSKPYYLGILKGKGTGKSTLCETMRRLCRANNILPLSINFIDAELDHWEECVPASLSGDASNKIKFALGIVSRMLYDRYEFNSLEEVRRAMKQSFRYVLQKWSSRHSYLAHKLLEDTIMMLRNTSTPDGNHRYERVLVIVDESARAVQEWPMSDKRLELFSVLTSATSHNGPWCTTRDVKGVRLCISGVKMEAFERNPSYATLSFFRPLPLETLNPVLIRDKWLCLQFRESVIKDLTTRFLAMLAPLPKVIADVRKHVERFVSLEGMNSEAINHELTHLRCEAIKAFKAYYNNSQNMLQYLTTDILDGIIFGSCVQLSENRMQLVAESMLTNEIRPACTNLTAHSFHPETTLFVLNELELTGNNNVKGAEERLMLGWLKKFSTSVINSLLNATEIDPSRGTKRSNKELRMMYVGWLEIKLNRVLQSVNLNRNKTAMSVLGLLTSGPCASLSYINGHKKLFRENKQRKLLEIEDYQYSSGYGLNSNILALLDSVEIPGSSNQVFVPDGRPLPIKKRRKKNVDPDPFIVSNLPDKNRPVVLIPQTTDGEPYDALLMVHREEVASVSSSSGSGPLIIALKFEQSLEGVDYPDGEEYFLEWNHLNQQRVTTEYFKRLKNESSLKFDFAYVIMSSKVGRLADKNSFSHYFKDDTVQCFVSQSDYGRNYRNAKETIVFCRAGVKNFLTPTVWELLKGCASVEGRSAGNVQNQNAT